MQGVGERIAMKKNPGYAPTEGGMEMKKNRVYGLRNPANRQSGSEIGTDANLLYGLRQGGKFESEIGTEENLLYGLRQGGKSESEICTKANLLYGLRQIPKERKQVTKVGDEEEGYVNEGMDK